MHRRFKMSEKKGISPVIATVILVAVATAIAIAVAIWASGIAGSYGRTEMIKLEHSYVESAINSTSGATYYTITLSIKNVGSADAIIIQMYANSKPLKVFWPISIIYVNSNLWIDSNDTAFRDISFPAGSSITMLILLPSPSPSTIIPGQIIEIKLETANGIHYIGTFVLS